jgi:hypothetical protein
MCQVPSPVCASIVLEFLISSEATYSTPSCPLPGARGVEKRGIVAELPAVARVRPVLLHMREVSIVSNNGDMASETINLNRVYTQTHIVGSLSSVPDEQHA